MQYAAEAWPEPCYRLSEHQGVDAPRTFSGAKYRNRNANGWSSEKGEKRGTQEKTKEAQDEEGFERNGSRLQGSSSEIDQKVLRIMNDRARIAYEAFSSSRKSGRRGPPWDLLPEFEKDSWRAVARAVSLENEITK
jgi:hypothetical protein